MSYLSLQDVDQTTSQPPVVRDQTTSQPPIVRDQTPSQPPVVTDVNDVTNEADLEDLLQKLEVS